MFIKKLSNNLIRLLVLLKIMYLSIICRFRYIRHIKKLRTEINKRTINVLFLVNEISKWKGQSLYDALEKDQHFNPIIGLTFADIDWKLNAENRIVKRNNLKKYFDTHDMRYIEVCDVESLDIIDLTKIKIDIIFYQQPWNLHKKQTPLLLSRNHLTCYFPYYVPNYASSSIDYHYGFHNYLWKYYVLNNDWLKIISNQISKFTSAVKLKATGHPILDLYIRKSSPTNNKRKLVIYAPHWSVYSDICDNEEKFSTFQHNGKQILEFAKQHPEINWHFKPHPTLKISLLRTKLWTENQIDEYYNEWAKIGSINNNDYIKLFAESNVLITDCGSFLVEYPCTKKPIIRLVSSSCGFQIPEPSKKLFDSFYNVNNLDEMYKVFEQVIIKDLDPKKEQRISAVNEAGLLQNSAATNIINDLYSSLNLSKY